MSVNSKMTALADEIRTLSGTTEALGIDAMTSNVKNANNEIIAQTDLITQIQNAVDNLPDSGNGNSGANIETCIGTISTSELILGEQSLYYLDKYLTLQCIDVNEVSSIEVVKNSIIYADTPFTNEDLNIFTLHDIGYGSIQAGYVLDDFTIIFS